jgi:uncharacterized membrane protein HdeD (DUF308 family)
MATTNRQRANGIAGGIISIILGLVLIIMAFPIQSILIILSIGAVFGLYKVFQMMRNTIEDSLDEQDANNKWKQERNIK